MQGLNDIEMRSADEASLGWGIAGGCPKVDVSNMGSDGVSQHPMVDWLIIG